MWNRHYSAWSEVLGADLGEVLIFHPKWWFTSQLLVTSLTSSAHLSTWWEKKGGGQMCSPVPPQHFGSYHSQADPGKGGHWQLVTKSYLSIISQNASSLSQDYCVQCAGPLLSLYDKGWSFHSSSVTPELTAGLPWTLGLAKWQGWQEDSFYMTQKKLLQQPTMGLWPSLYLIKGSMYSHRASHPTCDLTDPHYLPPSLWIAEEHEELVLDSSSPYL